MAIRSGSVTGRYEVLAYREWSRLKVGCACALSESSYPYSDRICLTVVFFPGRWPDHGSILYSEWSSSYRTANFPVASGFSGPSGEQEVAARGFP